MSDNKRNKNETLVAKKIKESANQIWLAGLGAYAKAEEEGNRLFDTLVKDGKQLEDKTKGTRDKKLPGIEAAFEKVEEVRGKATGSWERIEKAFDERVSHALNRLNIPTHRDVEELGAKVDALQEVIQQLSASIEESDSSKDK